MPQDYPPQDMQPRPHFMELPAGSFLWRIAKAEKNDWPPNDWPPRPAEAARFGGRYGHAGPTVPTGLADLAGLGGLGAPGGGSERPRGSGSTSVFREFDRAAYDPEFTGRFDPTPDCPFPYCYAAFDDLTAICEVLLRDVSFMGPYRYVPKKAIEGFQLMILETLRPLWLVKLMDAADLAAAGQDSWLIHAESADCYDITRRWAHWLRDSKAPEGNGPAAGIVWRSKREPAGRAVLLFGDRTAESVVYSPFGVRPLDIGEGREWLTRRLDLLRTRIRGR
jgi:hypothetical protein